MEVDPEYQELVDLVSKKDLDFDFPNSSVEHAKYILSKIIENTKKSLLIYSRNLNNEIFSSEPVLNSLKANKDVSIRILLDDQDKNTVANFKHTLKNIEFRQVRDKNDFFYFVVGDSQRIRICSREKPHQARVNFNKKLLGERLSKQFESFWSSAYPV